MIDKINVRYRVIYSETLKSFDNWSLLKIKNSRSLFYLIINKAAFEILGHHSLGTLSIISWKGQ